MAQIQKARQDVQSRQLQRKNELRANWEKRFEKVLRSKVDHDDALLQKLDALEKEEARRVIDSQAQSPSKSSEARDKLRRARERCERIEEEQRMRSLPFEPCCCPVCPREAACSNSRPPAPPSRPPKVFQPVFLNLRFWGKGSAPKAPKFFYCPS